MTSTTRLFVLLMVAIGSLGACDDADLSRDAHPSTLTGTVWRVVTTNGLTPVAGSEPTVAFSADQIKGSAGCNSYFGQYAYNAGTGAIVFQGMGMTAMACLEQGRMEVEAAFTQAISQASSASIDPEGRLVLSGPGGEIVLAVDAVSS